MRQIIFYGLLVSHAMCFSQSLDLPISTKSGLNTLYNPAQNDTSNFRASCYIKNNNWSGLNTYALGARLNKISFALHSEQVYSYHISQFKAGYSLQLDSTLQLGMALGISTNNLTQKNAYLPLASIGLQKNWENGLLMIGNLNIKQEDIQEGKRENILSLKTLLAYQADKVQVSGQMTYSSIISYSLWLNYEFSHNFEFYTGLKINPNQYVIGGRFRLTNFNILASFNFSPSLGVSPLVMLDYAR